MTDLEKAKKAVDEARIALNEAKKAYDLAIAEEDKLIIEADSHKLSTTENIQAYLKRQTINREKKVLADKAIADALEKQGISVKPQTKMPKMRNDKAS